MPAWARSALLAALAFGLGLGAGAPPAGAQLSDLVSRTAFRVCSDPANLPFSNEAGEGFENDIAALMAERLGRELQYAWYPMAQGFVRRTLLDLRCDVIIGYAQGDELVLNTNHYYTSTHVLVTRADGDIAGASSLADPRLQGKVVGVIAGSPPASHVATRGLMSRAKPYPLMVDTRHQRPVEDMLRDLSVGTIDAAVLWGPAAGPLARSYGDALVVAPLIGEEGSPRLFYRITMGVRPGEDVWKRELNDLLRELQPEIDAILVAHGVPILNDMGTALKAVEDG
jgi:quinoprotein dehydrogenase-associated probable ABC transporter substrate-binding protein